VSEKRACINRIWYKWLTIFFLVLFRGLQLLDRGFNLRADGDFEIIATARAIRTDFVGAGSPEFIPQTNNLQKPAPPH
jgi:hypothetical protein